MQDQVGFQHLFQRGAEGRDEGGGQIGNEAHRIGQDNALAAGHVERPHGGVESGEQHVLRHHLRCRHAVEQGGLAGIGVADQRDDGIRHATALLAVQLTGAGDALKLVFQLGDAVLDVAAVSLYLGFAGAADKAEATALTLKVGPGADQAALLVDKVGQFHLQSTLTGGRALTEDLEDQARAVQHLGLPGALEIALLDGGDRAVDDDEARLLQLHQPLDLLHLAFPEQGAGLGRGDRHHG